MKDNVSGCFFSEHSVQTTIPSCTQRRKRKLTLDIVKFLHNNYYS